MGVIFYTKHRRQNKNRQTGVLLRNFYTTKEIINRLKRNPTEQEECLQTIRLKRINVLSRTWAIEKIKN